MTTQELDWTHSTLNQEIFSSGVLAKNYTAPLIQKKSTNDSESILATDYAVEEKQHISKIFFNKPNIVVGIAVTIASAFVWSGVASSTGNSSSLANIQFSGLELSSNPISIISFKSNLLDEHVWLAEFYESASNATKAKHVYPLISGIRELFVNKEYSVVDDILFEMDHSRLSHTAMVAFITSTFPARDKLANWPASVQKVKLSLERDGLNSNDILQGLV